MSNQLSSLTTVQLRSAADLKEKIEALNDELSAIFGASESTVKKKRKRNKMSAAGRAKIAAAQTARWAKVRSDKK